MKYNFEGNFSNFHTMNCYNERPLKCCSRCKRISFCQNSCLESAWKSYHKEECQILRKVDVKNKIPHDIVRLLARIIFKLQKGKVICIRLAISQEN